MPPDHTTLRVVTPFPQDARPVVYDGPPCDDTYTCECPDCTAERATRVRLGVRRTMSRPVKRAA